MDGSPNIDVTFPDGNQDSLVLSQYYSSEEDRMARKELCNYLGHLTNDPTACVAVSGCSGSDDLYFTILSKHDSKSGMFKLSIDGIVEKIESPFKV